MLSISNTEIRRFRQNLFSLIITKNLNNFKILLSRSDKAPSPVPPELYSSEKFKKCSLLHLKVSNITGNIAAGAAHYFTTPQSHTALTLCNFCSNQSHGKVVQQLRSATCVLDVMTTKPFKVVFNCLVDDVIKIVNTSLLTECSC